MSKSLEKRIEELEKELKLLKDQVFRPKRLDVKATAQYVGLAEKTIRNRISKNDGSFPQPRRDGKKVLWLLADLDAYLEAQE